MSSPINSVTRCIYNGKSQRERILSQQQIDYLKGINHTPDTNRLSIRTEIQNIVENFLLEQGSRQNYTLSLRPQSVHMNLADGRVKKLIQKENVWYIQEGNSLISIKRNLQSRVQETITNTLSKIRQATLYVPARTLTTQVSQDEDDNSDISSVSSRDSAGSFKSMPSLERHASSASSISSKDSYALLTAINEERFTSNTLYNPTTVIEMFKNMLEMSLEKLEKQSSNHMLGMMSLVKEMFDFLKTRKDDTTSNQELVNELRKLIEVLTSQLDKEKIERRDIQIINNNVMNGSTTEFNKKFDELNRKIGTISLAIQDLQQSIQIKNNSGSKATDTYIQTIFETIQEKQTEAEALLSQISQQIPSQHKELSQQIKGLQEQLKVSQEMYNLLDQRYQKLLSNTVDVQATLNQTQGQTTQIHDQTTALIEGQNELKETLEHYKKLYENLKNGLNQIPSSLTELVNTNKRLTTEAQNLSESVAELRSNNTRLLSENASIRGNYEKAQLQLNDQANLHQNQLDNLQYKLTQAEAQYARLGLMLEEQGGQILTNSLENFQLQSTIEALRAQIRALKTLIDQNQQIFLKRPSQKDFNELEARYERSIEERGSLDKQLERLSLEFASLQQKLERLSPIESQYVEVNEELNRLKQQYQVSLSQYKQANRDQQNTINDLTIVIALHNEQLKESQKQSHKLFDQYQELSSSHAQLTDKLKLSVEESQQLNRENKSLKSQLSDTTIKTSDIIRNLKLDIEQLGQQLESKNLRITELENAITQQAKKLENASSENQNLTTRVLELNDNLGQLRIVNNNIFNKNEELQSSYDDLEQRFNDEQSLHQEAMERSQALISQLQVLNEKLLNKNKGINEENVNFSSQITQLNQQLLNLQESLENRPTLDAIHKLTRENENLNTQMASLNDQLNPLQVEAQNLRNKISNKEEENTLLLNQMMLLQNEYESLQDRYIQLEKRQSKTTQQLQTELETFNKDRQKNLNIIEELNKSLENSKNLYENKIEEIGNQNVDLQRELKKANTNIENLSQEISTLSSNYQATNEANTQLSQEIDLLTRTLNQANENNSRLNQENTDLNDKLEKLTSNYENLFEKNRKTVEDYEALKIAFEELQTEKDRITLEKEEQKVAFEQQVNTINIELEKAREELAALQKEREELIVSNRKSEAKNMEIQTEEDPNNAIIEDLKVKIQALEARISTLPNEEDVQILRNNESELKDKINALKQDLKDLKSSYESSIHDNDSLQRRNIQLAQENDQLKALADRVDDNIDLEAALQSFNSLLLDKDKEIKVLKQELADAIQSLSANQDINLADLERKTNKINALNRKIQEIEEQNNALRNAQDLSDPMTQENARKQLERLESRLQELQQTNQILEEDNLELSNMHIKLVKEKSDQRKDLDRLNDEIANQTQIIDHLETQLENVNAQLSSIKGFFETNLGAIEALSYYLNPVVRQTA